MKRIPLLRAASTALLSLLAFSVSADARAKFEPADGLIYHGYCLSGYWTEEDLDRTLNTLHEEVSDRPWLLYSMFVHAKENGRWNGWEWRAEGPDGQPVHGAGKHLQWIRDRGYTPVMAWTWMDWSNHATSPSIAGLLRGEYDWYIDEWIDGIKEFADPIFIRLSHEMDGDWYPYSEGYPGATHTAEDFVEYWKYVVDRFRAADVDNVAWVWSPDGTRQGVRDWVDYYPGDEYVDWLGLSVYSNKQPLDTFLQFREAFGTEKPIMIAEGGTEDLLTAFHPDYPGNAQWIRDFYDAILEDAAPQVKAVMWFQWNDHSWVQRDPEQLPVYLDYTERDMFISELALGGESGGSDIPNPLPIWVEAPTIVDLPLDDNNHVLNAKFHGFEGNTGSKWSLLKGDPEGISLSFDGATGQLRGKKAGNYRVKVEAWDKQNHSSTYIDVAVGASEGDITNPIDPSEPDPTAPVITDPTAPRVELVQQLALETNGAGKTVHADLHGLSGEIGGRWSIESGNASGLSIASNLTSATIRGLVAGEYVVKAQFWDPHVSAYLRVSVTEAAINPGDGNTSPSIVGPDWVEIAGDNTAFKLETTYSGFKPTGGRWSIERGDPKGLTIEGNGEIVKLKGTIAGDYIIKTQAWVGDLHVSKHIRVTVVK